MLGFRVGIPILFNTYGIIAPIISPIIFETPILAVVVYVILLLLSILLAMYLIRNADILQIELLVVKQFIKKIILLSLAGFSLGFTYWSFLQIFAMMFLIMKK